MGFFSAVRKIFGSSESAPKEARETAQPVSSPDASSGIAYSGTADTLSDEELTLALREAEPKLSVWLGIVLQGVEEADDLLWRRLSFLLAALETPEEEAKAFTDDFRDWLARMDYHYLEDFRSELQYRLALALDMEDEEDERDRLFLKLNAGLARTRAQFGRGLNALFFRTFQPFARVLGGNGRTVHYGGYGCGTCAGAGQEIAGTCDGRRNRLSGRTSAFASGRG